MMKIYILLMAVAISGLMACSSGGRGHWRESADTLAYQYKKYTKGPAGCNPDSPCNVIRIRYPQFVNQTHLNDSVQFWIGGLSPINKQVTGNIAELSDKFMKAYSNSGKASIYYKFQSDVLVVRQDSGMIALQVYGYAYAGGRQAATSVHFINWDTKAQHRLSLADLLKPGYEQQLNLIAEKIFRGYENLSETVSLAPRFTFADNKFAVNNNFVFTNRGIRFLFNTDEVKSTTGQTDLLVPYELIKTLIKPHTPVSHYVE